MNLGEDKVFILTFSNLEGSEKKSISIQMDPSNRFYSREEFVTLATHEWAIPALRILYDSLKEELMKSGEWDCEVCGGGVDSILTRHTLPGNIEVCASCAGKYRELG